MASTLSLVIPFINHLRTHEILPKHKLRESAVTQSMSETGDIGRRVHWRQSTKNRRTRVAVGLSVWPFKHQPMPLDQLSPSSQCGYSTTPDTSSCEVHPNLLTDLYTKFRPLRELLMGHLCFPELLFGLLGIGVAAITRRLITVSFEHVVAGKEVPAAVAEFDL